jgi:hypothetical protein
VNRGSLVASVPESLLAGNGAALVRERELARNVQRALERLYRVEPLDDVRAFVRPVRDGGREELVVQESSEGLAIALHLPELARGPAFDLDGFCQLVEGVSHFVLLAERARFERSVSALELEVQAEVDKFAVLFAAVPRPTRARGEALSRELFERVAFAHAPETELGIRYRDANALARRWVERVGLRFAEPLDVLGLRASLRAFFRAPLEGKVRLAHAA